MTDRSMGRSVSATEYDAFGFPTTSTQGAGPDALVTHFGDYNRGYGEPQEVRAPGNLLTTKTLDGFGRIERSVDALGVVSTMSLGQPTGGFPEEVRVVQRVHVQGIDQETHKGLDRLGRAWATKVTMPMFPGEGAKWAWTAQGYDALGRLAWASSRPRVSYQSATDHVRAMSYDLTDRVMDEVAADGSQVSYRYAGNKTYQTNELGGVASRTFDATGKAIRTTDRLGNAMTKAYGPFGALYKTTDADDNEVTVVSDAFGNVVTLDDPSAGIRHRTFSSFGELLAQSVVGEDQNQTETFTYNSLGQLVSRHDGDGETRFEYDGAGRVVSSVAASGVVKSVTYQDGSGLMTQSTLDVSAAEPGVPHT